MASHITSSYGLRPTMSATPLGLGGTIFHPKHQPIPEGFLRCDGSTFDTELYDLLYAVRGSDVLPDFGETDDFILIMKAKDVAIGEVTDATSLGGVNWSQYAIKDDAYTKMEADGRYAPGGHGLGTFSIDLDSTSTQLHDVNTTGFYSSTGGIATAAGLDWSPHVFDVLCEPSGYKSIIAKRLNNGAIYSQEYNNALWSPWRQLAFTDNPAFTGPMQAKGMIFAGDSTGTANYSSLSMGAVLNDYGSIGYGFDCVGANYVYKNQGSDYSSHIAFNHGGFTFRVAPSSGSGINITYTDAIRIDNKGNVGINVVPAGAVGYSTLHIKGTSGAAGGRLILESMDGTIGGVITTNQVLELRNTGTQTVITAGGVTSVGFGSTAIYPGSDNSKNNGLSNGRWAQIFATTATINTSDAREKQQIRSLDEAERNVAIKIKGMIKAFKFNDAVDKKGDKARIHIGVIAQEVAEAFVAEGLVPSDYALFCYDEWPEETVEHPEECEMRPTGEIDENGSDIQEKIVIQEAYTEVRPSGNRYGIRYEELFAFIIAALEGGRT